MVYLTIFGTLAKDYGERVEIEGVRTVEEVIRELWERNPKKAEYWGFMKEGKPYLPEDVTIIVNKRKRPDLCEELSPNDEIVMFPGLGGG